MASTKGQDFPAVTGMYTEKLLREQIREWRAERAELLPTRITLNPFDLWELEKQDTGVGTCITFCPVPMDIPHKERLALLERPNKMICGFPLRISAVVARRKAFIE